MKKLLLTIFLALTPFYGAHAQDGLPFLSGRLEIQGAVIPLYAGLDAEPPAIVRVDRIYTDYLRKGFFRIGILPVAVMQGVTVEVRDPGRAADALPQMRRWVDDDGRRRIEFRQLKFRIDPSPTNCLEAGRGRLTADGCLELLDGVRFGLTNQVCVPRATLRIAGVNAGQLVLQGSPPTTNNLFLLSPGQIHQPKEAQNEDP